MRGFFPFTRLFYSWRFPKPRRIKSLGNITDFCARRFVAHRAKERIKIKWKQQQVIVFCYCHEENGIYIIYMTWLWVRDVSLFCFDLCVLPKLFIHLLMYLWYGMIKTLRLLSLEFFDDEDHSAEL